MAHLGGELFSRYLIAVEVAGTLLLVALVGAVAIVAQAGKRPAGSPASPAPQRLDPRIVNSRRNCTGRSTPSGTALRRRQEVLHG